MKLLLIIVSIFVLGCSATPSTSVEDQLQQLQQEVKQMKRSNEESIATMKQTYDEKIASLEQQLRSVEVSVAFSTSLQEDVTIDDNAVIFENVDLNIEGGYDEFTGVFRPPVNGVYLLTFYGLVQDTNGGDVFIRRDDDVLCHGWLTIDREHSTAACTAVAELTTDDSVRVTGNSANPAFLRGNSFSGFAGFLIYDS